jgi:hypothetical protein
MAPVLRSVAAFVAGIVVAFLLVVAVELFGAVVHPVPPDFRGTTEEMCRHVERYPHWVLALVVPAWGATAFAGAWVAGRLGNRGCALLVGLLIVAALVLNISMLPYPIWFKAANLIVIPCAIVAAVYLAGRRPTATLNVAA